MFLSASAEIAAEAVLLPGVDLHVAAFQAERGSVARLHGFPGSREGSPVLKGMYIAIKSRALSSAESALTFIYRLRKWSKG